MEFSNVWYVDENEVEALWSQLRSTVEVTTSTGHTKSFWASLKAGLSKWKLVSAEAGGEVNISENVTVTEREMFLTHRKILDIIKELGGEAKLLSNVLTKVEGTQLVYVSGYFALEEIFFKGKPEKNILGKIPYVKKADDLVWHLKFLPDYNLPIGLTRKRYSIQSMHYAGKENNNSVLNVEIYADGKKMSTHVRHLTQRIEYKKPFYFKIIGWLEWVDHNNFYIKPVVIMR